MDESYTCAGVTVNMMSREENVVRANEPETSRPGEYAKGPLRVNLDRGARVGF